MQDVVQELISSAALLVLCSFAIGFVFDRTQPSLYRDAFIGFIGGGCTFAIMAYGHQVGGVVVDGRTPVLIVTAFFGGPLGALLAAPLPLAMRAELGGPYAVAGVLGIVIALGAGATLRLVLDGRGTEINRVSVVILALLSPLPLIALAAGPGPLDLLALAPVIVPLLVWIPLATLGLGSLVLNEWIRASVRHEEAQHQRFLREADHVSREILEAKLRQDFRLHERYSAQFGYMLISIDDAAAFQDALSKKRWDALRAKVARALRQTVRECDVCAPVAFDRFGVVMPYAGQESLVDVAQRIQSAVKAATHENETPVTVSVGIAHVQDANSALDLEVIAEQALVLANAVQPRGAIGPQLASQDDEMSVIRSFPGALFAPDDTPVGDDSSKTTESGLFAADASPAAPSQAAAA